MQTWYVPSKNSFHDLEKRKLEIKKIWSKWTIFLNVPLKNVFQVHGNTFWWFEFAHPAHTLVMTHSSLISARELRYLLSMHASKKKFIFGMKLYLVVLNCVFRKKNILVWNTSILPLDFQSTVPIGLWKDSNFSPILSASWIVFY